MPADDPHGPPPTELLLRLVAPLLSRMTRRSGACASVRIDDVLDSRELSIDVQADVQPDEAAAGRDGIEHGLDLRLPGRTRHEQSEGERAAGNSSR